jgi:hypothetical protein
MSNILEYFHIPKLGKTKQRIPVKEIIEQLEPSVKDKRILNTEISSIYLEGVLDAETLRIPSYVSDEHLYEAIYILQVVLKTDQHFLLVNEKLQYVFPNPIVIVYLIEDKVRLSLAPKRINKLTKDKSVIESVYFTSAFHIDELHKEFLELINLVKVKAANLKEFYENLMDIIYSENLIEFIGVFPRRITKTLDLKQRIKEIEDIKASLDEMKSNYKQITMMSQKMDNHMKIVNMEDQLKTLVSKLKEELLNE